MFAHQCIIPMISHRNQNFLLVLCPTPLEKNLVGGIPTPLKNMKVSWDDYSQYMEKEKRFQTTNQKHVDRAFCPQ